MLHNIQGIDIDINKPPTTNILAFALITHYYYYYTS